MFSPMHVSSREITVATLLRDAGYDTCHSGKWHLNGRFNLPGQPQPVGQLVVLGQVDCVEQTEPLPCQDRVQHHLGSDEVIVPSGFSRI